MKNKNWLVILFSIFFLFCLILCYILKELGLLFLFEASNNNTFFYEYFNNQTVAALISGFITASTGAIGIFVGFYLWQRQHKIEINDKNFERYVAYILKYFAIKQKELEKRKDKNKRSHEITESTREIEEREKRDQEFKSIAKVLNELDLQEVKNEARIKSFEFLLRFKNYDDKKIEQVKTSRDKFASKFDDFTKDFTCSGKERTNQEKYEKKIKEMNECLDKSREEILNSDC